MILLTALGILILCALSVFQLLLIMGKPLGNFAWGGQHEVLPQKLRIASICTIAIYGVFGIFLVSKAGLTHIIQDSSVVSAVMWVITCYFILGIFMNGISRNKKERAVMTPVVFLLAVVFLVVTLY